MKRACLGTGRAFISALVAGALFLAAADGLLAAEGAADPRLDPARLSETVEKSIARLTEKGARWTAITQVKQKGEVEVEVVQFGGQCKYTATARVGGERTQIFQLIERDGSWYVKEKQGIFGKYRPYEAPFFLSTAYVFLERGDLFFASADFGSFGVLEGVADGVACFRQPIDEETKALLRQMLSQMDALPKEGPLSAKLQAERKRMADFLEHGLLVEVDLATGILTRYGAPDVRTRIEGFAWLDSVPENAFTLDGAYPDFTSDPTAADLNESVMIAHCGVWKPGLAEGGDTDVRLLNLKTGELRRIPFLGAAALPGCFLKDRKRVVVYGMMTGHVGVGLYEVDLSTGENRKLGGAALDEGFCFGSCVSPDGKLVAVKHMTVPNPTLPSQIYVVELESGDARKIGEIVGGLHLSWMPDGKRILMTREEFTAWDKPSEGTICTMALDGTVEDICPGEWPVLIGRNRIMFTPREKRVWHTCNLDGSDVKILGDGLRDYGFPTVSPDGTRLLMMRFDKARGPRPTVIKIGDSRGREAVRLGGLWGMPVWR
jgi:hypothetical protein